MPLEVFTHRPTQVGAIQVTRPFKAVKDAVPFSRIVTGPNGRTFSWLAISSPGSLDTMHAYEGDWIIRHPNGKWSVMGCDEFAMKYRGTDKDGHPLT